MSGLRVDQLIANSGGSRYAAVIMAAKRARQLNDYHHLLGEGTLDESPPPLVETRSKNYLTIAIEEIQQGKIVYKP